MLERIKSKDMHELLSNWLLVSFDKDQFDSQVATLQSGIKIDKRFNPYEYAVISGVVAKVCKNLYYSDNKGQMAEAPLEFESQEIETTANR